MSTIYEITSLTNSVITGTMRHPANMANVIPIMYQADTNSISTGSWQGLNNTWGTSTQVISSLTSSASSTIEFGTWKSSTEPDHSWGVAQILSESHEKFSTISNEMPEIDQGITSSDWDPFPAPTSVITTVTTDKQRDLTRYKKTYSSQRLQPKRIRLVRS